MKNLIWLAIFLISINIVGQEKLEKESLGKDNSISAISDPIENVLIYEKSTVDIKAVYPKGIDSYGRYISNKLAHNREFMYANPEGRIIVEFVIEKDGKLSNIKVIRHLGYGSDKIVIDVLENSSLWVPAQVEGKVVRQKMGLMLPIKAHGF